MPKGRKTIYTDAAYIDRGNVVEILRDAMKTHQKNAAEMEKLLKFEAGVQPLRRTKKIRPDIDCECVDNIAHEVVTFNLGFKWGNPITLVQRGNKDSGSTEEAEAISLLNECYEGENIRSKTQKLGRFVEIVNLGYTHVDVNTDWEDGDSFFRLNVLDPRTTFIVRSSYHLDQRPMLAVCFRKDEKGITHYTCYTRDTRFEISEDKVIFEEMNPLGKIPIIEWVGNYDGQGCFEHEISEMENLNLLISDFTNDVDQNTQAIWHGNDVDFPVEEVTDEDGTVREVVRKPESGDWVLTETTRDGKQPFVKPLAVSYDYPGMLENIITRRALILQKCHIPQRNDNSGGSTGTAMDSAAGWSDAECVAKAQQNIMEGCKLEELKVVLAAIRISPDVPADSPLLKLRYSDIQPNIKRNKTYELATKVNALATMIKHGIYGLAAFKTVDMFDDPMQVWEDSKELVEAYQESIFQKEQGAEEAPNADRMMQDKSDQAGNSPLIGG